MSNNGDSVPPSQAPGAPAPPYGQPPHGQPPYGQPPHGQPPHGQPPHGQQPPYGPPFPQQPYYQAPHDQQYAQNPYAQNPYTQNPYAQPGYPPPVWIPPVPVYPYAVWIRRVGAYLIDFAPAYVAMIPYWIGYGMFYVRLLRASTSGDPDAMITSFTGTPLVLMGVGGVLMLAAFGWQWYNRWLIAGRTGQSMGKRVLDTKLVAEINGQPIGPVNAFLRDLLHVLDALAYIGYLWPLWDAKRQTFADMIMKTVVVDLRQQSTGMPDHDPTRHAAA